MVFGLEFLGKGASLLFILGGRLSGDLATAQAVVFTIIVIEVVVAALALALVVLVKRTYGSLHVGTITARVRGGGP
jgi:multisubunit Na+/H+ antiporter MnhC subunit